MGKPKFTRINIQEIIQSGAGLDTRRARELTGRIIEALAAALTAGETVELRGLGTLEVRERKGHMAHNPNTGEAVIVPSRRRVLFRPGAELKAALRGTAPDVSNHV
jgi:nucleoid DNA-binding protein